MQAEASKTVSFVSSPDWHSSDQVYLAYEYTKHSTDNCDVPLQLWVQVVSLTALFNLACNQQDRYGTLGARIFCGWSFDPENPERMPMRNCVGLYWAANLFEGVSEVPECCQIILLSVFFVAADFVLSGSSGEIRSGFALVGLTFPGQVAPGLLSAVHAYASFNLTYSFFILLGVAGLSQILFWLARRGLIRVSDAAPPGSLERNTEARGRHRGRGDPPS
ncbi:unnamed protein product [Durusdinium trenchii]|uniref:Uncharacterized protein n=1 Tax=Durusdinium trenchii TaxID=1381693 RepID=A0ABP0JNH6_9DINO